MKAPKLLSWFAHRAGISADLALKLWRRAAGEAELLVGNCDSSSYHALCVERFMHLLEEETGAAPAYGSNISWIWQHQRRMADLGAEAARSTYRLWRNNWTQCMSGQRRAA